MRSQGIDEGPAAWELTAAERTILLYIRSLTIDQEEVPRRLATPAPRPLLPSGQELHANLGAVSQDPLAFGGAEGAPLETGNVDPPGRTAGG